MKTITTMLADEIFESINENNNKVLIDLRKNEDKKNQSPVELLLSALAACGAGDIVLMLKKRRKTIDQFVIETEGKRKDQSPRSFTSIHCLYVITSGNVTEEELTKIVALSLEKYCSVAASLTAQITFSVTVKRP